MEASGAARPPSSATSAVSWPRARNSAAAPWRTSAGVLDGLGERPRGERDHEHVLHVDGAPGVRPAREHVDHRQRQQRRAGGEQPPERRAGSLGGGQRAGHRRRQHGVGAQARERGRAVEVAQRRVDHGLIGGVAPAQQGGDLAVDGGHRAAHAAPGVARAAVAPLVRLVAARGRARGHGRAGLRAAGQRDDAGHRGRPARVERLEREHALDRALAHAHDATTAARSGTGSSSKR